MKSSYNKCKKHADKMADMIQVKKPFPKKAKLITDGGFYRIMKIDGFVAKYTFPLMKRITLCTPETNALDMTVNFTCEFSFSRIYRGYAEYKQYNVTSIVK